MANESADQSENDNDLGFLKNNSRPDVTVFVVYGLERAKQNEKKKQAEDKARRERLAKMEAERLAKEEEDRKKKAKKKEDEDQLMKEREEDQRRKQEEGKNLCNLFFVKINEEGLGRENKIIFYLEH